MSWFHADFCVLCAGSSGAKEFVDDALTIEWKSVLHVCQQYRADGSLPFIARTKRRNGATKARRAQRGRLTAPPLESDADDVVSPVEGSDIPPHVPSITPRITKRKRREGPSSESGAPRSRRNTRVRD